MNYEMFEKEDWRESRPAIPETAYQPAKRCPNCQSVYLTGTSCEACGRSLLYHPVGLPFSAKSLYGFKERYYATFPVITRYFPVFENKTSASARSYVRQLSKRFDDLLQAFGTANAIEDHNRRFFYVEMMELIDELLRYGHDSFLIQQKIESSILETGPLLSRELLLYLQETKKDNFLSRPWTQEIFDYRIFGFLRLEYVLKVGIITATVVALAVGYYEFISLQVGK